MGGPPAPATPRVRAKLESVPLALHKFPLLFVFLVLAIHAAIAAVAPFSAGLDDAEQIVLSQTFELGYGPQPPLYTWIFYSLSLIFGASLKILTVQKLFLLFAIFMAVYHTVRLLGADRSISAACCLSLALLPQLGWESVRALSHTVLAVASCAACYLNLLALKIRRRSITYASLGFLLGCGLLSKYNFAILLISIVVNMFFDEQYRKILIDKRIILTCLVFFLFTAPHLHWMYFHVDQVMKSSSKLGIYTSIDPATARVYGLLSLTKATVLFLAVYALVLVAGMTAPRVRSLASSLRLAVSVPGDFQFFLKITALALAMCALIVVASGSTNVKDRWLFPILFMVPPLFTFLIAQSRQYSRSISLFTLGGALVLVAVIFVIPINRIRDNASALAYDAVLSEMRTLGHFETIICKTNSLCGNLRAADLSLRVLTGEYSLLNIEQVQSVVAVWPVAEGENLPDVIARVAREKKLCAVPGPPLQLPSVPYWPFSDQTLSLYMGRLNLCR